MILNPDEEFPQPNEVEIALGEAIISPQQGGKNRRPLPADNFLFSIFDQIQGGENIGSDGDAQADKHEKPAGGSVRQLEITHLLASGRWQANQEEQQQHAIGQNNQNALHDL